MANYLSLVAYNAGITTLPASTDTVSLPWGLGLGTVGDVVGSNKLAVSGTSNFAGALTIASGGLVVSASGAAITGNSTVTGTLGVSSDFAVATNKFSVAAASGNTLVAGTLGVTGASTLAGLSATTGSFSSTLGVAGDFAVATNKFTVAAATGNTVVAGTLTVSGNLTISGTTTTVSSTSLTIADNLIGLNSGPAGAGKDGGLVLERYGSDVAGGVSQANGTAGASTAGTITLTGGSAVDSTYVGYVVKAAKGGQTTLYGRVTAYVGATTVATLTSTSGSFAAVDNTWTWDVYKGTFVGLVWDESASKFMLFDGVDGADASTITVDTYKALQIGALTATSGAFSASGTFGTGLTVTAGGAIITAGGLSVTAGGVTITAGGLDVTGDGITNAGAISGATTIAMGGALSGATTIGGSGLATLGSISAGTGTFTVSGAGAVVAASLDNSTGGITNAGALSGVTTLAMTGALSGATSGAFSGGLTLTTTGLTMTGLDIGAAGAEIGDAYTDGYIRFGESAGDPTNVASKGFLYSKDVGGKTELFWFSDQTGSGASVQVTSAGGLNVGAIALTLDTAYNNGRAITVDAGPVVLNHTTLNTGSLSITPSVLAATTAEIDVTFAAGNYTGTPGGLNVDYSAMTSLSNAGSVYGVSLVGKTNAGAGDSIGLYVGGFDKALLISGSVGQDSGLFNFNGNAASTLNTTGANLTVSTTTSGTLLVASEAALNIVGVATDIQASGALTIDSTSTIGIGTDADAQAINIGTGAAARAITIGNQTGATALTLNSGTGSILIGTGAQARAINVGTGNAVQTVTVGSTVSTSMTMIQSGSGKLVLNAAQAAANINIMAAYVSTWTAAVGEIAGGIGTVLIAAGDAVCFDGSGLVIKADADAAGKKFCVGFATNTVSNDGAGAAPTGDAALVYVAAMPGQVVSVNTDMSAGFAQGAVVYLDTTAGQLSTTAPSASGSAVFRAGYVHTIGAPGTGKVFFQPQFIAQNP